ncbi:phage terminase small subunit P27 family [Vibrio cholerae]|uniref:phage terminase small subunit P27 family n=1 Tax=Vibrio cholerae TaxID=666 RepID=UPI002DBFED8B|nr:phage terminase small subunit P27 family [Vibrio cholerae]
MGRPSKSIAELKANGTYRPNKHGKEEDHPQLAIEAPQTPRFLNEEAFVYFQEIVGYGLDMDIITKADAVIVGLLSNELGEWAELNKAVREEGVMVKLPTATGFMQDVVNPKLKIRDDKTKVILKMLGELGMSPAARSKVQVNEKNKQEKSVLGEFLAAIKPNNGGQAH